MKKILSVLCVGIFSIGLLGGCTSDNKSLNEIVRLESELVSTKEELINSNVEIKKLNMERYNTHKTIKELEKEVEVRNRYLGWGSKARECIDDEELQWLKIEDWDKIIIRNREISGKVEIKGEDLPNGFTLYSTLESLITYQNIVREQRDSPKKTEFYTYEFFKDNNKYEINIWADEIVQVIVNGSMQPLYYKSSNLEILGKSFMPPTEYQYTDNVLNKIYNSGFFVDNVRNRIINPNNSQEIAKWIVGEISRGVLEKVNEIPNINVERKLGATAYWYGERVHINLYRYEDIEYIEIINNGESAIYKETAPYSIGALLE